MTWGSWGKKLPQKEMISLMNHCLFSGISSFDHADIYGGYTNEAAFGKAFTASKIAREKVQLITKCGIQLDAATRRNKVKHYCYAKDYIIWSAEQSLKNLETDYLDLFLLHRPSPLMDPLEIGEAISILLKTGKIRSFGVSNFSPSQIAILETAIPVRANQIEFSLTANEALYDGSLDDTIVHHRSAMAWSPLGSFFKGKNKQQQRIQMAMQPMKDK